ncbi:hypothetical protein ACPXB5_17080 [Micromonospora arida]|uniref:Uncharacterized protein n=1 Tax=Micromonospora arida TaxID=2203715 RepID=A0A3N9X777_9ACTN|nr:hypothetical protein [Micromonospora arida]RQX08935.1 hypothetical protein DLJ58_16890 [Micromonospora arida]
MRRVEERFRSYSELAQYVMHVESASGRSPGAFSDSSEKRTLDAEHAEAPQLSPELAARLTTYGSVWLDLQFVFWRAAHLSNSWLATLERLFVDLDRANDFQYLSDEEWGRLRGLVRISNRRGDESADRLLRQIRAELEGETSWRRGRRRIKNWWQDRRNSRKAAEEDIFVEEEIPIL